MDGGYLSDLGVSGVVMVCNVAEGEMTEFTLFTLLRLITTFGHGSQRGSAGGYIVCKC